MRYTFLSLLLLMTWHTGFTQSADMIVPIAPTKARHTISFTIGLNQGYLKDSNFSPLNYNSRGPLYSLEYQLQDRASAGMLVFGLDFSNGMFKTKASDIFNTDYLMGNLHVGYLRKVKGEALGKSAVYVGGRYHFHINYLDWDEQQAFSFLVHHSLELSSRLVHQATDRDRFQASLNIPVLGLIVRPPYSGIDEELILNNESHPARLITDGYLGSFNKMLAYDLELSYQRMVSDHILLQASYLNRFQRVSDIHKFLHFHNQFKLGTSIQF